MARRASTGYLQRRGGVTTNLLTNGSFASATTGWTASGATLASTSGGQTTNCLTMTASGAAEGSAYADVTTRVGRVYLVKGYYKDGTSDGGILRVGTTSDADSILTVSGITGADWTEFKVAFMATATTTRITLAIDADTTSETGLFDEIVVDEIWPTRLSNFLINIYTGAQPTSANDAASGTLLCTISLGGTGTGLEWGETSTAGVTTKVSTDTWQGVGLVDGTAGWARFYEVGDNPALASTTAARIDGAVGTSSASAELVIPNTFISATGPVLINTAQVTVL